MTISVRKSVRFQHSLWIEMWYIFAVNVVYKQLVLSYSIPHFFLILHKDLNTKKPLSEYLSGKLALNEGSYPVHDNPENKSSPAITHLHLLNNGNPSRVYYVSRSLTCLALFVYKIILWVEGMERSLKMSIFAFLDTVLVK